MSAVRGTPRSRACYWQSTAFCRTTRAVNIITSDEPAGTAYSAAGDHILLKNGGFLMRRLIALCAATAIGISTIAVSTVAVAHPAPSGYYVIRWDNTGICQIWNTQLQEKPISWPSNYAVVSKPVPTFAAASAIQEKLRLAHRCTL